MANKLTEDEIRDLLKAECEKAGGQKQWAETACVSQAYVSDVLNNRRQPGDAITRALGFRKVVEYVPDHWEARDGKPKRKTE